MWPSIAACPDDVRVAISAYDAMSHFRPERSVKPVMPWSARNDSAVLAASTLVPVPVRTVAAAFDERLVVDVVDTAADAEDHLLMRSHRFGQ